MNTKVMCFESAYATVSIDTENKIVFIENLESAERGLGHASELLNTIKRENPDYVICGNMQPTDCTRPEKPSQEDMEKACKLGCDFATDILCDPGFPLIEEEKLFREKILEQYRAWKTSDPWMRLHLFYRKNHFTFPSNLGYFESRPPHTLYS